MESFIISNEYDGKPRKLYKQTCKQCGKEMFAPKHANKQFCSIQCRGLAKRNGVEYTCATCGVKFYRNNTQAKVSKSGYHFCSRACKDSAQCIGGIQEIMPPHYGTGNGKHDYQYRAKESYGNICNVCGITDVWNGKPIVLDVHHIDGNRNNNAIENLQVLCPNCHRQEEMKKWQI